MCFMFWKAQRVAATPVLAVVSGPSAQKSESMKVGELKVRL